MPWGHEPFNMDSLVLGNIIGFTIENIIIVCVRYNSKGLCSTCNDLEVYNYYTMLSKQDTVSISRYG